MSGENQIVTRLCPTGRGAIFRLKRAVWATISRLKREQGLDADASGDNWREFARALVNKLNELGVSTYPTRIILYYRIENNVFKPVRAKIQFARAPLEEVEFSP